MCVREARVCGEERDWEERPVGSFQVFEGCEIILAEVLAATNVCMDCVIVVESQGVVAESNILEFLEDVRAIVLKYKLNGSAPTS